VTDVQGQATPAPPPGLVLPGAHRSMTIHPGGTRTIDYQLGRLFYPPLKPGRYTLRMAELASNPVAWNVKPR